MNQPSAEEILQLYVNTRGGMVEGFQGILNRYHLIDKTEPIPGAVSEEELNKFLNTNGFNQIPDEFDLYPKGTVARLTGELEIMRGCDKDNESLAEDLFRMESNHEKLLLKWSDEVTKREALEAEVDRIKEESGWDKSKLTSAFAQIKRIQGDNKPEAVGCGREFTYKYTPANQWKMPVCGEWGHICSDCQAKALEKAAESAPELYQPGGPLARLDPPIEQVGRASKRVQLPDVPTVEAFSKHEWREYMVYFCQAVKAHLEGGK